MNRVRGTVVAAGVGVLLFGAAALGQAKGGGYLELDRRYYAPGNVAIAKGKSYGGLGELQEAGTVYAYLGSFVSYSWFPKRVPDEAILLGSAEVRDVGSTKRIMFTRFRFTVPDVGPGWYWVRFYDGQGEAVGRIAGFDGYLRVVRTTELVVRKEAAYWEGELSRVLRHRDVHMQRLRQHIEDLELLARDNVLGARSVEIEPQAVGAGTESRANSPASSNLGWGVAAVALAALAGFVLLSKRRSQT
jgi:hypothetical protein